MVGLKRSTGCQLYIHITLCRKEEVGSGGDSSSDDWRSLVVNETSHLSHDCGHWFAILLPINRRYATIAQYWKFKRSTVNDGEVKYANNRTYRRSIDVSTSV